MKKWAKISENAEADLTEIWWFIAQNNPVNASRFTAMLREKCQTLAELPGMGRERVELASGLLGFSVGNYLIFYRETDYGIEIARVVSGFRDLPPLFPDE